MHKYGDAVCSVGNIYRQAEGHKHCHRDNGATAGEGVDDTHGSTRNKQDYNYMPIHSVLFSILEEQDTKKIDNLQLIIENYFNPTIKYLPLRAKKDEELSSLVFRLS